jgi:hypothetical protein
MKQLVRPSGFKCRTLTDSRFHTLNPADDDDTQDRDGD